jgi:histone deacetylase complex regulatory component SIN3
MTYKEAIELKMKIGINKITHGDLTMKVFVTPAENDDFTRYVNDYRNGRFTDETSIKYSLNIQFKVYGLWTNGTDVIFKDLPK